MKTKNRQFGDLGERLAEDYLKKNGYEILEKNWQRPCGEIDLIAGKGGELIFVEVKTSRSGLAIYAEQNVHRKKLRNIIETGEAYLTENKHTGSRSWQIDVIMVEIDEQRRLANLRHLKNVLI